MDHYGKERKTIIRNKFIKAKHIHACNSDDNNIILYNNTTINFFDSEGKFLKQYGIGISCESLLYKSKDYCLLNIFAENKLLLFDLTKEKLMGLSYTFSSEYYYIKHFCYPFVIGYQSKTSNIDDYEYTWVLNLNTLVLNKFYYPIFYAYGSNLMFVDKNELLIYNLDAMELIEKIQIELDNIKKIAFNHNYFVVITENSVVCYE